MLSIFLSVVQHVIVLLSLLRTKILSELSMNMRGLQVLILFHVMDHHSYVILTSICDGWILATINYSTKASTLRSAHILRLIDALSRFLIEEESSSSTVHELFQHWDFTKEIICGTKLGNRVLFIIIGWYHVTREQVYYFTISHLLVVVRINYLKKDYQLFILVKHSHLLEKIPELIFIYDTVTVCVHLLEELCEFVEEFLMLWELEVQDCLLELCICQFLMDQISIHGHTSH